MTLGEAAIGCDGATPYNAASVFPDSDSRLLRPNHRRVAERPRTFDR